MVDGWITWLSDYLLPAAVITDDRIIITWGRPIKRDQLYSINCGLRAFRRSKDLDGARE